MCPLAHQVHLDNCQLRALQLVELELLCEFRRVCDKAGIPYAIIAGTLLGAVRHGGFIPWDDDADVALLREDYEKFREACKTELNHEKFYFQDQDETPGYRWGYGKLRKRGTQFVRIHQESMPYEQGVFIDVFPLDSVPNGYAERCLMNFLCMLLRKALWSEIGKTASESAVGRIVFSLMAKIPLGLLHRCRDIIIGYSSRLKSDWVRILMFPTPNRCWGYPRCYYENTRTHSFEGQMFLGPSDYEGYLTFKFGDWRTLPPENQRKTHPVSEFKVE